MTLLDLLIENIGRRFAEWSERRRAIELHVCDAVIQRWRVR
jgi:hypothetical protein